MRKGVERYLAISDTFGDGHIAICR